jgi:hypothetical protein
LEVDKSAVVAGLLIVSCLGACSSSDEPKALPVEASGSADTPNTGQPVTPSVGGQGGMPVLPVTASGDSSALAGSGGFGGFGGAGTGGLMGVGGLFTGGSAGVGGFGLGGGQSGGAAGLVGSGGGMGAAGSELTGMAGTTAGGAGGDSSTTFTIRFDYRFDTAGFFEAPERRAALEAAGAIWSRLIRDDFDVVPAGTAIRLRNPENRDEYVWVDSIEEDIDDLVVFVGSSDAIPGLGRGGSAGLAESSDPEVQAALTARASGADFEPWAGSISFNPTSDFFYDPTPDTSDDIPFEQFDFITNAAHELGHVLGFLSGSVVFDSLIEGETFVGARAQAVYGGPVPLTEELGHFPQGTLSEGVEPLMDAGQTNGIRSVPTPLDLAVFTDLGYEFDE